MRHFAIVSLGLILATQGALQVTTATTTESTPTQIGYGVGSVLGTLVYAPVKGTFCILGALGSAVALPFGGPDSAGRVIGASCRGTWVITPAVVRGREPVQFVGDTQ
jgi:hypothetical protein